MIDYSDLRVHDIVFPMVYLQELGSRVCFWLPLSLIFSAMDIRYASMRSLVQNVALAI